MYGKGHQAARAVVPPPAEASDDPSSPRVVRTPDVGKGDKRVRIVCISDTHDRHWEMLPFIPDGDVLIHAGDFFTRLKGSRSLVEDKARDINRFFRAMPHKYKIAIAGNHEIGFNQFTAQEIQNLLSECIYLQDSGVELEGLKFYGTPWTNSTNMGFSKRSKDLDDVWQSIPKGVDILITHLPPYNVLDLAFERDEKGAEMSSSTRSGPQSCSQCKEKHPGYTHWGCRDLRRRVRELSPLVHVFGHVHDSAGYVSHQNVLHINAAMEKMEKCYVVDVFVRSDKNTPTHAHPHPHPHLHPRHTPAPTNTHTQRADAAKRPQRLASPPSRKRSKPDTQTQTRAYPNTRTHTQTHTHTYDLDPARDPNPRVGVGLELGLGLEQRNESREFVGTWGLKMALISMPGNLCPDLTKYRLWSDREEWHRLWPVQFPEWMFPCDQPGREGFKYTVYEGEVRELLRDEEYMRWYREAVQLGLRAWGWQRDRDRDRDRRPYRTKAHMDEQQAYLVAHSLYLFRQRDLLQLLQQFLQHMDTYDRPLTHPQLKRLAYADLSLL